MSTLDGTPMTAEATTIPVGTGLRIAAAFVGSTVDTTTGVQMTIEAHYSSDLGRYALRAVETRVTRDDTDEQDLRRVATQALMQAAVPHCIAVRLFGGPEDAPWTLVSDLFTAKGRLLPPWLADAVVKRSAKEARMETISLLYGVSALAGLPPVKALQGELGVPHRTASDWIAKARKAGYLEGMNYHVGRQADGQ